MTCNNNINNFTNDNKFLAFALKSEIKMTITVCWKNHPTLQIGFC